jgi:hypothetical protein
MKAYDKLILLNRYANNREEKNRRYTPHACLFNDIHKATTTTATKSEMLKEQVILSNRKWSELSYARSFLLFFNRRTREM